MTEPLATMKTPPERDGLRDDVERLFQFAVSQALVPVDDDTIGRVVTALSKKEPRTVEDTTELWAVLNLLTAKASPATIESIRAIQDLSDDQKARPGALRWYFRDSLARRQVSGAISWVLATLIILVLCQFYSLALTSVLDEIRLSEERYEEAAKDLSLVEETLASTEAAPASLKLQRDRLDASKTRAEDEVTAAYSFLIDVAPWAFPRATKDDPASMLDLINARNISQAFLKGFALYLLPLIYGLLGANVYILRQLMKGLDGWNLTILSRSKYSLRRALGALVGATFGLLFDSPDAAIAETGFSLAALAFLGGYSAELFFTMLDTFIEKIRAAFSTPKPYAPDADAAAPSQEGGGAKPQ